MYLKKCLIKIICSIYIIFFIESCTSRSAQAKISLERNKENLIKIDSFNKLPIYICNSKNQQLINHTFYILSYSEKHEQPEWVSYKITSNNFNRSVERTNDYREDPFVSTQSASRDDYQGSNYDMGHLAPAHDMGHNLTAMSESFYLSNISPQKASFNRGIWKTLEGKVSYWSSFNDSIYVVTGPILDHPIETIGENKVSVPRAFYKTLLAFKKGKMKAIAFILPNEKSDKSIYSYAVPIDKVEEVTGIDFYYNLEKKIQDSLEANINLKTWISIK